MALTSGPIPGAYYFTVDNGPRTGRQIMISQRFQPGLVNIYTFAVWYRDRNDVQFTYAGAAIDGGATGGEEDNAFQTLMMALNFTEEPNPSPTDIKQFLETAAMRDVLARIRKWIDERLIPALGKILNKLTRADDTTPSPSPPPGSTSVWDQPGTADALFDGVVRDLLRHSIDSQGNTTIAVIDPPK